MTGVEWLDRLVSLAGAAYIGGWFALAMMRRRLKKELDPLIEMLESDEIIITDRAELEKALSEALREAER